MSDRRSNGRMRRFLLPRAAVPLIGAGTLIAGVLVPAASAASSPALISDPASHVDTLIGTSGGVNSFPGADVPFGEVQFSPDTSPTNPGGGYEYNSDTITGFSLSHISGPGCYAYGDLPFLPTTGPIPVSPNDTTEPFTHTGEIGKAGYYAVTTGETPVRTELSATPRTGIAQFHYPSNTAANLLIKVGTSQDGASTATARVVGNDTIVGSETSGHFCGANNLYTIYFTAKFSVPFRAVGTWVGDTVNRGAKTLNTRGTIRPTTPAPRPIESMPQTHTTHASSGATTPYPAASPSTPSGGTTSSAASPDTAVTGSGSGVYVTFDTSDAATVAMKVGVSFVSIDNSGRNLAAEQHGFQFGKVHSAAKQSWNQLLSKVRIGGGSDTDTRIFYTALYHSLLHPNLFDDVNGQYIGFDGGVHRDLAGHHQYANYSGWDIYRSQVQLAALLAPQQTNDIIQSMINDYQQGGTLPKWAQAQGESYVMVGDPADPIIADAYAFGARNFDTSAALDAMVSEATQPNPVRPGLNYLESKGYLPHDGTYTCCNFYGPVSTLLEYNTADFSIGAFAQALGNQSVANRFIRRAQDWQNVFDPATGFMQSRMANGTWVQGFSPTSEADFVEGNSWQYTPMVPFNVHGLIAAAGGNANWVSYLDSFFTQLNAGPDAPYAWAGNEPGLEIPWEYDYAGAPWKTQDVVRRIEQALYTDSPAGEAGNDDLGAMSSWYVWAALGMFPETPGTADLALGSPVFPQAVVSLANGHQITITAPAAATDHQYVRNMWVNGRWWGHNYLPSSLISNGGTVRFALSATPNTSRGTSRADAPPSYTLGAASAIGFTSPADTLVLSPGQNATVQIGARNLASHAQHVTWSATADNGITIAPTAGTLVLPAGGDATNSLTVQAGSATGNFAVHFSLTDAQGRQLPQTALSVIVARPGDLSPFYNNAGISDDNNPGAANFDGEGWSYSAEALAADGITPGGTVTVDGVSLTWPNTQPGQQDNIVVGGQTIQLVQNAGATKLAFVGSSTNGPSQGTVTLNYTDGTSSTETLAFSDWTLNAGGSGTLPGESKVATTPYRNNPGGRDTVTTFVFGTSVPLDASKTLASVTLPSSVSSGQIHVFTMATG